MKLDQSIIDTSKPTIKKEKEYFENLNEHN
jgi:hypothetical protein